MAMRCHPVMSARWHYAEGVNTVAAAWDNALRVDGWKVTRKNSRPFELWATRKREVRRSYVLSDGSGSMVTYWK